MLCRILNLGAVNLKFGGGIQKLHAVPSPVFLKKGTPAGGSGEAFPDGAKFTNVTKFFKRKF